ncbi:MAG: hypothetical protein WD045_13640 [Pirellulaceae bacterium]
MTHLRKSGAVSSTVLFAGSQLLFVAVSTAMLWRGAPAPVDSLPPWTVRPHQVTLAYDLPEAITDDQLLEVLHALRPRLNHPQPKINHVDHALRFWGPTATFTDPACLSGAEMFRILADQKTFHERWGTAEPAFIRWGEFGPEFRTGEGSASASHVDHTLGTWSEIGAPLDQTIRFAVAADEAGSDGQTTLREMLSAALRGFRVNQLEYEWTTVAAASYATGPTFFLSQDGERVTFDLLAERLMRQGFNEGVCFGNHRLYSLALLLQFDEQVGLFQESATRDAVTQHLSEATARLVNSQAEDGSWDKNWPDPSLPVADDLQLSPQARRLLATGHALEWWAIAPAEVHPPRETIIRAAQFLVHEVRGMEPATIDDNYTFLTHVGRALSLWRGKFPHQLCDQINQRYPAAATP